MRVLERIGMNATGHQSGKMRHIHHEIGTDSIGNLTKPDKIYNPRISRSAGNNHLRPMLLRKLGNLVKIDQRILAANMRPKARE